MEAKKIKVGDRYGYSAYPRQIRPHCDEVEIIDVFKDKRGGWDANRNDLITKVRAKFVGESGRTHEITTTPQYIVMTWAEYVEVQRARAEVEAKHKAWSEERAVERERRMVALTELAGGDRTSVERAVRYGGVENIETIVRLVIARAQDAYGA